MRSAQPPLKISAETRLLVVAPHPDDELLGAGGLIQRVHAAGGTVRIVYLTDGEGYPEGVQAEHHVTTPTAGDFRDFGRLREREARRALSLLHVDESWLKFLTFPDGGLCRLTTEYWSERAAAYESPYTRLDRPPRSKAVVPDAAYRGEDLTQELARLIGDVRPTLIAVTRKEDQHPDHCAAWFFVADALGDVLRVRRDYRVDVITYLVHFDNWPFQKDGADLAPPRGLAAGPSGWIRLTLSDAEIAAKREALSKYESQVRVMGWFLDGFARREEIFARPADTRVVLPLRRSPCCSD
jgi:LmbE family N-acetylglucosaminyl deacetylase